LHPLLDEKLEGRVMRSNVPMHMWEGIIAYLRYGRPCGSFLQAVISNDAQTAITRADQQNRATFGDWFVLLHQAAPSTAWGSADAYVFWLEQGKKARAAARENEDEPH
jgi:hypothetical protein